MPSFDPTSGLPIANGGGPTYDCKHCTCKCCCGIICGKTPCQLKITGFDLSGFKAWWDAEVVNQFITECGAGCEQRTNAYRVKDDTALDLSGVEIILDYESYCTWRGTVALGSVVFETGGNLFFDGPDPYWTDCVDPTLTIIVQLTSNVDGTLTREVTGKLFGYRMGGASGETGCPNWDVVYYNATVLSCPTDAFSFGLHLANQHKNTFRHWCVVAPDTCIKTTDYCDAPGSVAAPGELSLEASSYVDGCNRKDCADDCGEPTPLEPCLTCPGPCDDPIFYTGCQPPPFDAPGGIGINPSTGDPWKIYLIGSTNVGGTALDFVIALGSYSGPGACDSSDLSGCFICHQEDAFSIRIRIYCVDNVWFLTVFFPFTGGACTVTCTVPHDGSTCCPPTSFSTTSIGTPCGGAALFTGTLVYEYSGRDRKP